MSKFLIIVTYSIFSLFKYFWIISIYLIIKDFFQDKVDRGIISTFLFEIRFFITVLNISYTWVNNSYLDILSFVYLILVRKRY